MKPSFRVTDMGDGVYKYALVNGGELIVRRKDSDDRPNKNALEKSGKTISERKQKNS